MVARSGVWLPQSMCRTMKIRTVGTGEQNGMTVAKSPKGRNKHCRMDRTVRTCTTVMPSTTHCRAKQAIRFRCSTMAI